MKILLSIFVFALCFGGTSAQSKETELRLSDSDVFQDHKKSPAFYYAEQPNDQKQENAPNALGAADESALYKNVSAFSEITVPLEVLNLKKNTEASDDADSADGKTIPQIKEKEKFHWKPALVQSGIFLGIQHGFRLTQEKPDEIWADRFSAIGRNRQKDYAAGKTRTMLLRITSRIRCRAV